NRVRSDHRDPLTEPKGRGVAWTEERGTSDEGRRHLEAPRRRAEDTVTARVPAKLNLQLSVGPPRADGYHGLVTVFHAVSLFDKVPVQGARLEGGRGAGEGADSVPQDKDNLRLRAVAALRTTLRRGRGAQARRAP